MSTLFGLGSPNYRPCVAFQRPLTPFKPPLPPPYYNDKLIVYIVEYPPWTPLKTSYTAAALGESPTNPVSPGMPWPTTITSKEGLLLTAPIPLVIQNAYPHTRIRALTFNFEGNPATDGIASATLTATSKCAAAGDANATLTFCFAWCAQTNPGCTPGICNTTITKNFRVENATHCGMSFSILDDTHTGLYASPSYVVLELAQDCSAPGIDEFTLCEDASDAPCNLDCNTCVAGTTYAKRINPLTGKFHYVLVDPVPG